MLYTCVYGIPVCKVYVCCMRRASVRSTRRPPISDVSGPHRPKHARDPFKVPFPDISASHLGHPPTFPLQQPPTPTHDFDHESNPPTQTTYPRTPPFPRPPNNPRTFSPLPPALPAPNPRPRAKPLVKSTCPRKGARPPSLPPKPSPTPRINLPATVLNRRVLEDMGNV